jgi:hypothetical protein
MAPSNYIKEFLNVLGEFLGFKHFEHGEVVLSHGNHVLFIKTKHKAKKVWLTIEEPCHSIPVCHGDVNLARAVATHGGFNLFADIKTDKCEIEWFIEY